MNTTYEDLMKIGASAMESISDMVAALQLETAANLWVSQKSGVECMAILAEHDCRLPESPDDDEDAMRESLAQEIFDGLEPEGFEFDEDEAQQAISDDLLSFQVRSGWAPPGEGLAAEEFELLLTTGGPAVRIRGDVNDGELSRPRLEVQDWGTQWTEVFPVNQSDLQTYIAQFSL